MDYGALMRRAWALTWQNRFLWILGLFATSTVGSCSPTSFGNGVQYQASPSDVENIFNPDLARAFQQADPWLSRNIGLLLLSLILLAALFFVVFGIVSIIAQGGMAEATGELAMGRPESASAAWNRGLQLFWRYLLMWLLLLGLGLLVALVVAMVIGVGVAIGMAVQGAPRTFLIVLGGLLTLVGIVVGIPLFVSASIVVAFAQRAIALEQTGPWESIRTGVRVFRRSLGTNVLAWLLSLALSIGWGIVLFLVALVVILPLGALAVAIFYATGAVVSIPLAAYVVVAVLAFLVALWLVGGVSNAFFWNYWTLVYLHLTGRLGERLEPPEAGA